MSRDQYELPDPVGRALLEVAADSRRARELVDDTMLNLAASANFSDFLEFYSSLVDLDHEYIGYDDGHTEGYFYRLGVYGAIGINGEFNGAIDASDIDRALEGEDYPADGLGSNDKLTTNVLGHYALQKGRDWLDDKPDRAQIALALARSLSVPSSYLASFMSGYGLGDYLFSKSVELMFDEATS